MFPNDWRLISIKYAAFKQLDEELSRLERYSLRSSILFPILK